MNAKIVNYIDTHVQLLNIISFLIFIGTYTALGYFNLNNLFNIGCYYAVFLLGIIFLSNIKYFDGIIYFTLTSACIVMAVWGILQYFGCLSSGDKLFTVTGPFDNPAGIGMFIAILLPYLMCCCKSKSQCICIMRWLGVLLVIVVLLLSESRTGILAACTGLLCLHVRRISKKYIVILIIIVILICILLYFYKPTSANGRLFIWEISRRLASQHPWIGSGMDGFKKGYMLEQAAFFTQFPHSGWALIADDIKQPFNEYLLFFIRFGMTGLLLATTIGTILLRQINLTYSANKLPAVASLSACAVCGLFSYPSHYTLIIVVAILSLAILCAPTPKEQINFRKPLLMAKSIGIILLITGLSGGIYHYYRYESLRTQLEARSFDGEKGDELDCDYIALYHKDYFRHHALFLYNYGLYLYENKHYEEALIVWEQYFSSCHNYEGQMMYAYTLTQLSHYDLAIEAFKLASFMLPCRLQPRYELINLYERIGERDKACQCAKEALKIPLKVHTLKTEYLLNEIRSYPCSQIH